MATSSILGGDPLPRHVRGKDTNALGPSDNSDSGSDAQGAYGTDELSSDSDAEGTGPYSMHAYWSPMTGRPYFNKWYLSA